MNPKSFVLTVLLLQLVNQAYSIKCYECSTDKDADCASDPVPERYAVECRKKSTQDQSNILSLISNHSISAITSSYASLDDIQCAKIETSAGESKLLVRKCDSILMNCDNYKKFAEIAKVKLDSCKLCETDLCNSSSTVNAGILTLLAAIFVAISSIRQ